MTDTLLTIPGIVEYVCTIVPVGDAANVHINAPLEPIVRCRDCKHYVKDPDPIDPGWSMMCEDTGRDMLEPDGFCAWGERKVEG